MAKNPFAKMIRDLPKADIAFKGVKGVIEPLTKTSVEAIIRKGTEQCSTSASPNLEADLL